MSVNDDTGDTQSADQRHPTSRRALLGGGLATAALAGLAGRASAADRSALIDRAPWERVALGTSVKSNGAVGDGSTDDTAAIQGTIDAVIGAGGGTVLFPAGVYAVSAPIRVSADANKEVDTILAGEGVASRIVRHDPSAAHALVEFDGPAGRGGYVRNCGLRDLAVGNSSSGPEGADPAVRLNKALHFSIDRCLIEQPGSDAISFMDSYIGSVTGSIIRLNDDGIVLGGVSNAIRIIDNRIQANQGIGITMPPGDVMSPNGYIPQAMGMLIAGNDIEGNGAQAILFTNGVYRGVAITGNYFERNFNPTYTEKTGPWIHKTVTQPPQPGQSPSPYADFQGVQIAGNFFNFLNHDSVIDDLDYAIVVEDGRNVNITANGFYSKVGEHYKDSQFRIGDGVEQWLADPAQDAVLRAKGDVEFADLSSGVVLRSPNGSRFRLTVDDDGGVSAAAL